MLFLVLFLSSCGKGKVEVASHNLKLDTAYSICTYDVNTLVSDSGLIQYRLRTKEWRIYSQGENPRWYFPEGLYLEQFGEDFKTKATVKADTGRYFTSQELWELIGNVQIRNLSGEQFFAPRMYWDRKMGRVFSPDSVYILTPDQELRGHSFDAIQDMSKYTFVSTTGSMEYKEESESRATETPQEKQRPQNTEPTSLRREQLSPEEERKRELSTPSVFPTAPLPSNKKK